MSIVPSIKRARSRMRQIFERPMPETDAIRLRPLKFGLRLSRTRLFPRVTRIAPRGDARQRWSRGQVETRFANMRPCLIGMEACVGSPHLRPRLQALGHDARSMPAISERMPQLPDQRGPKDDLDGELRSRTEPVSYPMRCGWREQVSVADRASAKSESRPRGRSAALAYPLVSKTAISGYSSLTRRASATPSSSPDRPDR